MQSEISYDTPVGKGAIPLMSLESVFRSLLLNPGIKTLWGHNPMKKIKKEGSGKMFNTTLIALQGFHPRRFVLTYYLNWYYVIIAIQRRDGQGGQVRAPPSSYQCFVFHSIRVKGILQSRKENVVYHPGSARLIVWSE